MENDNNSILYRVSTLNSLSTNSLNTHSTSTSSITNDIINLYSIDLEENLPQPHTQPKQSNEVNNEIAIKRNNNKIIKFVVAILVFVPLIVFLILVILWFENNFSFSFT